jgi:hypothetical protein
VNIFSLLDTILLIAAIIFIVVKLNQMAADLATIARHYQAQQPANPSPQAGNPLGAPQGQTPPAPVKPHNLAGFSKPQAGP